MSNRPKALSKMEIHRIVLFNRLRYFLLSDNMKTLIKDGRCSLSDALLQRELISNAKRDDRLSSPGEGEYYLRCCEKVTPHEVKIAVAKATGDYDAEKYGEMSGRTTSQIEFLKFLGSDELPKILQGPKFKLIKPGFEDESTDAIGEEDWELAVIVPTDTSAAYTLVQILGEGKFKRGGNKEIVLIIAKTETDNPIPKPKVVDKKRLRGPIKDADDYFDPKSMAEQTFEFIQI